MTKYIDMHIHSNYSDGVLNPEEIIFNAKKAGVKTISITDHDGIDNFDDLSHLVDDSNEMIIVPGIEVSSNFLDRGQKDHKVHILGYGVSNQNVSLLKALERLKQKRFEFNTEYTKELLIAFPQISEDILKDIDYSRYYRIVWQIINYLKQKDDCNVNMAEVKKYCRKIVPRYYDYDLPAEAAIDIIRQAGGIPILAHPMEYRLREIELKRMIKTLMSFGLEGIEVYQSECSKEDMDWLRQIAESYQILYSCGSDFHFFSQTNSKIIGHGINDNLCIQECSLVDKVLKNRMHFNGQNRK